jgi:lysophospholipase L1-like esterase
VENLYQYHSGVSDDLIGEENPVPDSRHLLGIVPNLKNYWQGGRLATVKRSIILIMLGTNDVGHGFELDKAPDRVRALLDIIFALPDVGHPKVFWPLFRRIAGRKRIGPT